MSLLYRIDTDQEYVPPKHSDPNGIHKLRITHGLYDNMTYLTIGSGPDSGIYNWLNTLDHTIPINDEFASVLRIPGIQIKPAYNAMMKLIEVREILNPEWTKGPIAMAGVWVPLKHFLG